MMSWSLLLSGSRTCRSPRTRCRSRWTPIWSPVLHQPESSLSWWGRLDNGQGSLVKRWHLHPGEGCWWWRTILTIEYWANKKKENSPGQVIVLGVLDKWGRGKRYWWTLPSQTRPKLYFVYCQQQKPSCTCFKFTGLRGVLQRFTLEWIQCRNILISANIFIITWDLGVQVQIDEKVWYES